MATVVWQGDEAAVKQIATCQVTAFDAATTYTLTVTGEDGNTFAVNTTGSVDVNTTATNISTDWNNAASPYCRRVTATVATDTVTLTADVAGQPFTIASTKSSGTGTIGAVTDTTTSSGPNDAALAGNYDGDALPGATDVLIVPAGTPAILYNLDEFSGDNINGFRVEDGYSGAIGGTDGAYFQIGLDTDDFYFAGTGVAYIDVGVSSINPVVANTAVAGTGSYGLYFKGSAITNFYLKKGQVGFGVDANDAASRCDVFHVSYLTQQASDAKLTIGENTLAVAGGAAWPDVTMYGGTCVSKTKTDAVVTHAGDYTQDTSVWVTATAYNDAVLRANGVTTYETTNLHATAHLRDEKTLGDKNFTLINVYSDDITIEDPIGHVEKFVQNGCGIPKNLNIGFDRTVVITP